MEKKRSAGMDRRIHWAGSDSSVCGFMHTDALTQVGLEPANFLTCSGRAAGSGPSCGVELTALVRSVRGERAA